jgi:hypothetical protein
MPAIFAISYGGHNCRLDAFVGLSDDSVYFNILKEDYKTEPCLLSLTDAEVLKSLITKAHHKNVLGQIVNYINEGNSERWKDIYMKNAVVLSIQEILDFTKHCLQYQHLSPLALMEQQSKN